MWRVIATDKDGREISRKEMDAGEFTLGRDQDRQMVLASASVSRRHCRVRIDPGGVSIVDDKSANGVTINGSRIPAEVFTLIPPGARVEIAEFRLLVEQLSPPAPMMPPPMMPPPMMQPPMVAQQAALPMQAPFPNVPSSVMPMSGPPMGLPPQSGGPTDVMRLIAEGGQYAGRVFDLPNAPELTIGRGVGNELVLDDPSMSRKHSKIRRLGGGRIEVEDLNSANGTYVNGRKVSSPLQAGPGDTVRFGELTFRIDGSGGAGASRVQLPMAAMAGLGGPGWLKPVFLGGVALTGLVWIVFLIKLIVPSAPAKGIVEQVISTRLAEAATLVSQGQGAFNKQEWSRAKEAATKALEIDPANIEAVRLRAHASRSAEDSSKYKQAVEQLERGTAESLTTSVRLFESMLPDSTMRQELADKLATKLGKVAEEYFGLKKYKDSADMFCQLYKVAPASQRPAPATMKRMRDAEKKAKMTSACPVK